MESAIRGTMASAPRLKRSRRWVAIGAALVLAATGLALSPTIDAAAAGSATVQGTVFSDPLADGSREPLAGVRVQVYSSSSIYTDYGRAVTDANGQYSIDVPIDSWASARYRICFLAYSDHLRRTCWQAPDVSWPDVYYEADVFPLAQGELLTGMDAVLHGVATATGYLTVRREDNGGAFPISGWIEFVRVDEEGVPLEVSRFDVFSGTYYASDLMFGDYRIYAGEASLASPPEYWPGTTDLGSAELVSIHEPRDHHIDWTLGNALTSFRVTGSDRFGTSVAVSQGAHWVVADEGLPVVYLTNGLNYPDALAAGPAAIVNGGVVLLTYPWALPDVVRTELERLRPQRVVVVGGENSVSSAVEAQVRELPSAPVVNRVTGQDRFATSRELAADSFAEGSVDVAFIATGLNFPDALAAGSPAGLLGAPIILVNGRQTSLDAATRDTLEQLGVTQVFVIGGPPSVSVEIESDLRAALGTSNVERITGADRFGTAIKISQRFFSESEFALIATGTNFPDALAGGPWAGLLGAPLYLSHSYCLNTPVYDDMVDLGAERIYILGGYPSLDTGVEFFRLC
jgi:putative cell wall-binding protein